YSALHEYYVLDIPDSSIGKIDRIIQDLYDNRFSDFVERNEVIKLSPMEQAKDDKCLKDKKINYAINDPDVDRQWGFLQMHVAEFYKALKSKKPARKAKIAILDTGIDSGHEDLKDNYLSTDKQYDADRNGHGTHCAGIAGAVTDNKTGIASMAL